jgi:hypothetical protein
MMSEGGLFNVLIKKQCKMCALKCLYITLSKLYFNFLPLSVAYPGIFFEGEGSEARIFFFGRGSTNSVENRGQREQGSGDGIPLVRGSTQFASE